MPSRHFYNIRLFGLSTRLVKVAQILTGLCRLLDKQFFRMRIACFCIPFVQKTYCAHAQAVNCLVKQPAKPCSQWTCEFIGIYRASDQAPLMVSHHPNLNLNQILLQQGRTSSWDGTDIKLGSVDTCVQ